VSFRHEVFSETQGIKRAGTQLSGPGSLPWFLLGMSSGSEAVDARARDGVRDATAAASAVGAAAEASGKVSSGGDGKVLMATAPLGW
jgi:hypothetical protein